ncbi:MAG: helix-turn-helix transcriptional regulator [Eubacterium sp.]|nr:helix-turn-helix transcriptional regulator [Candidatus Colimonas fimequi]
MDTTATRGNILGSNLRFLREITGRSQEELAYQMHMSRKNYMYIETGRRDTNPDDAIIIERVTDIGIDTLLHVDMRAQLLDYLRTVRKSTDYNNFVDEYAKLSRMGKLSVGDFIEELLQEESMGR